MDYYKYNDEDSSFSDRVTYLEVDDGCALRQVSVSGEQFVGSNMNYPHQGFELPDQQVNYDDFEEIIRITQQEFAAVWNQHLAQHHQAWETTKALYPVGRQVTGAILIFYPQGVIVDLGSNALGVADYAQCRASTQPKWMYPKHQVDATVEGYDEENHWIKLVKPQVLAKTIK